MCGITGIISNKKIDFDQILMMNNEITHRGPDGSGTFLYAKDVDSKFDISLKSEFNSNLAFGHRRLSILDLSENGAQPMKYENFIITYNGEIYNYLELKSELIKEGYTFKSGTDTEVFIASYKKWGRDCLDKFNGMWAFSIVDLETGDVFISRDRFGIKPLYYYKDESSFYFSSEVKQLLKVKKTKNKINEQTFYEFLTYGITNHKENFFIEDIVEVKGGHCLSFNLNDFSPDNVSLTKWYDKKNISSYTGDFDSACDEFQNLFNDSVKIRLRADVAIGSCLSGGLDSSLIVCVVNKLLKEQGASNLQKTFSLCSNEKKYDERKFVDIVTNHTKVGPYYTYPDSKELLKSFDKLAWHQDAPFPTTSIFAQWDVFKLAANNNVKVMLDGQGADEILAGYHQFFKVYLNELVSKRDFKTLNIETRALKEKFGYSYQLIESMILTRSPEFLVNSLRSVLGKNASKVSWLNNTSKIDLSNPRSYRKFKNFDVNSLSRDQVFRSNLPMLLHFEDRNSMAHSIESRVPFLDYRLVEFLFSLDGSYKINRGTTKYIMRESYKDLLPPEIYNRSDKMGFVTPEETWLKGIDSNYLKSNLSEFVERTNKMVSPEIIKLVMNFHSGKSGYDPSYFRVLSAARWASIFDINF